MASSVSRGTGNLPSQSLGTPLPSLHSSSPLLPPRPRHAHDDPAGYTARLPRHLLALLVSVPCIKNSVWPSFSGPWTPILLRLNATSSEKPSPDFPGQNLVLLPWGSRMPFCPSLSSQHLFLSVLIGLAHLPFPHSLSSLKASTLSY